MDKATNLFIRFTCGIICFSTILLVSPKIEDLGDCIFKNQYRGCDNIGFSWLYKIRKK